ncbi:serine/threonine-protein kinase [Prosthecobacter sp.]|uniref:serine/threonine-protein kinase n=1 Tax=Prosthecobacter sp. TaxID=1965333 RepID=UPI002489A978|nr:serine/threonine-protein kinase [Prosthecobacter sp.]MDI1313488.1 serine/threonine-protein kinase [Prosthecobacter sp.]
MQQVNDHGGGTVHFEPFIPPSTEELDALIPGYKFIQFIERGGMGAVYKAVQKSLNRTVAVKLLPQVHRNKESFAERFKREAHALAQLNHPHIIGVHDFGETPDGQMYYVMEFVSGMDLQHLLKRAPPEPRQILKIITQVCEALQFAHEHGIVHRDIKPANILVDERGNVKVADFGLAKVMGQQAVDYTATGMTIGTPDYIAPEALDQSRHIDHRADIYSLGVMIYELFTGHVPKGVWEPPSIRSGADKGIDAVVSKAMQNNPEKRYQHVRDMTQVLEKLFKNSDNWKNFRRPARSEVVRATGEPVRIPSGADTVRMTPVLRSKGRMVWMAGAMLLLAGAAGIAWQAGWLSAEKSSEVSSQAEEPVRTANQPAAPEQMKLAEWVLAHEGFLNVKTAANEEEQMGGSADILYRTDLPPGPFTIWRASLSTVPLKTEEELEQLTQLALEAGTVSNLCLRGMEVPVSALVHLSAISTLKSLDLSSTSLLTDDAVEHLAACRSLHTLRISKNRLPAGGSLADKLGLLLPECKIVSFD